MKVKIYGRSSGCSYCDTAKELCKEKKIDFDFIDIEAENIDGPKLAELCGKVVRTVPQIFIDDQYIGGCDNFKKELSSRGV